MTKKILLSGVKPTGTAHIGNYFGAMKQFVDAQTVGQFDCIYMLADYHALNFIHNKDEMMKLTIELAMDYLAIGLDPEKCILFKQSDVSAHTELAWIFDTIVSVPYLERAHAYKDAEAKEKEISMGTFNYPVLMAADILLYNTDVVPVGQDQKQHVEYARDIALKFNHTFTSETFKLPEDLIMKEVAVVPGIDGRKMSKSYSNTIPLFAERAEIIKAVMAIVTDSSGEVPMNVYNIHRLFRSEHDLKSLYETNKGKYKILKDTLVDDIDTFLKPMRERRAAISSNPERVMEILAEGAQKARKLADVKLMEVKKAIGVL
ncbi:MAG: tryptophan--tRNA ligase [bacterium]|nr:tryptophan--tRNA ligase [bacterium]